MTPPRESLQTISKAASTDYTDLEIRCALATASRLRDAPYLSWTPACLIQNLWNRGGMETTLWEEQDKRKAYPDYVRDVARHKIILQLDRSHVPGQVAGDALLCRIPCVGGDGAIERMAFSKICGEGRTIREIALMALDLLKNRDLRTAMVAESQERARERVSFERVGSQLAKFFAQLQATTPKAFGVEGK